ncbi:MAG: 2-hydroxycarboxylate transporter family protein, partial [Raoultibacter sp.]
MTELENKANALRIDIVDMIARAGSGHPGGSLSCADILAALYLGGVLHHDAANPEDDARDRFILSKGHAAPALYAALAHAGYFPREELSTLRQLGSRLPVLKEIGGGAILCLMLPSILVFYGFFG